jgi:hypothetical protein
MELDLTPFDLAHLDKVTVIFLDSKNQLNLIGLENFKKIQEIIRIRSVASTQTLDSKKQAFIQYLHLTMA